MSFKVLQAFFCLDQQMIELGRSNAATAAVHPLTIGFTQEFVHSAVHDPEISGTKIRADIGPVRGVQTVMQALPICQVHIVF